MISNGNAPRAGRPRTSLVGAMLVAWGGLATVLVPCPAPAQTPTPPEIVAATIGFGDTYKLGYWTPLRLTLRGGSTAVAVVPRATMLDDDGTPATIVAERAVQLLPGRDTEAMLYVRVGNRGDGITIELLADERVVAAARMTVYGTGRGPTFSPPVLENARIIVHVGPEIGLAELQRRRSAASDEVLEVCRLADAATLPTRWYGYEAVDTLVLAADRAETVKHLAPGTIQHEALAEWLRLGGRVVLAVGAEAHEVIGPGGPLAWLTPGRFTGLETLTTTAPVESFSGTQLRIPRTVAGQISVPLLDPVDGVIDAAEGKLPIVVRGVRGFGLVTFIGVDLHRRPFADWPGRVAVVNRLLDGKPLSLDGEDEDEPTTFRGYYGFDDLSGQLRGALDRFEGVRVIPFSLVALLVFVYVLLIGPGDYFFLKLVVKRMELTWLTFPALVVLVSAAAYGLAYWSKGNELRVNKVDVMDFDVDEQLARGVTWLNLFSPRTRAYDLTLKLPAVRSAKAAPVGDGHSGPQQLFSWFGLPGSGLGGMSAAPSRTYVRPYHFAPDLSQLQAVPVSVWSSKAFVGRWQYPAEIDFKHDLELSGGGLLSGTLTNPLPETLSGCLLVHDRWAYKLGDLHAGQSARVELGEQIDLQSWLKGAQVVEDDRRHDFRQVHDPYDPTSFDVRRIVHTMLFYKASGGYDFSGLQNSYQGFVDLSDQTRLNRALLFGVLSADQGTQVLDGSQALAGPNDRNWVFCRVLFSIPTEEQP